MHDKPLRLVITTAVALALSAPPALSREIFVGGPVHKDDMEIVANYLVGIEMAPMMPSPAMRCWMTGVPRRAVMR